MPVVARQHIQRMRGGANAHLMLADNDSYYVVKFRNNPQHQRVLVNELICSVLLDYLGLPAPSWELVEVRQELIDASPRLTVEAGSREWRCQAGLHFGSRYVVNPSRQAVYDFVPSSLLRLVFNVDSFSGMVAFDKWVSNANGRQAVFFRDRAKNWIGSTPAAEGVSPRSLVFVVNMIDHGFAFNAQNWNFSDSPEIGLYTRREVYQRVQGFESFEPWLNRITNCPSDILDDAYKKTPPDWHDGAWDRLESLLEKLYNRRSRIPELLLGAKKAIRDPFPNWRQATTATS